MEQPNYAEIWKFLHRGQLIPFLGSGASLRTGQPPWRPGIQPPVIPSSVELARHLASEAKHPRADVVPDHVADDLSQMAEYFERCPTLFGRPSLHQHLQDALGAQADWCPIHEYLAKVAATKPLLIFTTNYDDLMERAIRSTGAQCDVIMYTPHHHEGVKLLWCPDGREPREVLANALAAEPDYQPTKRTTLFKLHGSIAVQPQDDEQGHYVATLDDYAQALVQMGREQLIPTAFSEPMEKRPFLFLGYSLRDINVRHLLTEITARRGRTTMHSVAFQGSAGRAAVDLRDIDHELWNLRGVKIHYVTCDELVAQLKRLDPP